MGAASRVFAARPYHVVCMDDVAEAARVGKGTLYRYFPSKEDLYLGVVAEAFDLLIGELERVEAEDLPPAVALSRMIEAIVETFARHLPFFRLMQQGEARLFLRKKQVVRARRDRIADGLARAPRARGPDGGLPEGGPRPRALDADRARVGHDAQSRGRHAGRGARPASRGLLPPRDPPAPREPV